MNPEKHGAGVEQAERMLRSFASLGVSHCDLTRTGIDGRLRAFQPGWELPALLDTLPGLLAESWARRHNLMVRPRGSCALLVQLDDLPAAALPRLQGAPFLVLATSPENYQAWVALQEGTPELARRLRQSSGADPGASGAVRLAGSFNFKQRYAPRFPRVTLVETHPGRTLSAAQLETLGVVAAAPPPPVPRMPLRSAAHGHWPSYPRCLEQAPLAQHSQRPDISRADFTFCLLAIDWGWSEAETARRLLELSPKARLRGAPYACLTAQRAAAAVERRPKPLNEIASETMPFTWHLTQS